MREIEDMFEEANFFVDDDEEEEEVETEAVADKAPQNPSNKENVNIRNLGGVTDIKEESKQ